MCIRDSLDGAHVEYLRGVRNPIAIKVGPSVNPDQLLRLIDVLNPDDEPGRLTFIHRMGAAHIAEKLPPLLNAVRSDGPVSYTHLDVYKRQA